MAIIPIVLPLCGAGAFLMFFAPRFGATTEVTSFPLNTMTIQNPIAKGLFFAVILYIGRIAFFRFVDFSYTPGDLYIRYLLGDYLGPSWLTAGAAFFFNRRLRDEDSVSQFVGYLVFFTFVAVVFSVGDALLSDSYWTGYELFLRPVLTTALLALFPVAITSADNADGGGWAVLILVIAPFLCGLPAMWSEWLSPGLAAFAAIGVVAFSVAAVYWLLFRSMRR